MEKLKNHEEEIAKIASSCPIPLSNIHLKRMEKDYLIPYFKNNEELEQSHNRKGRAYITLDGKLVKSSYELLVSNFFHVNEIDYCYDLVIPAEETDFRYDFRIGEIFIEIFGYYGQKYNERKKEKIELYERHKLQLISLDSLFFQCRYRKVYEKLTDLCKEYVIKTDDFAEYNQFLFLSGSKDFLGYIQSKLLIYISENNTLPNSAELREMGFSGIERIINNLGGFKDACDQLGLNSDRFRKSWNEVNSKREFLSLCERVKRIPTDKDYEEYGLGGLKNFIKKNQKKKKLEELARRIGFVSIIEQRGIRPSGHWDMLRIIETIKPLCDLLERIPTKSELLDQGMSELESAIQRYTSREELSKILAISTYNLQNGVKTYIFEDLKEELTPIIRDLGYFPSRKELNCFGKGNLYGHINKFGGPSVVANKLNTVTFSDYRGIKGDGFWRDKENIYMLVEHELLPLVQELGYIPNESFLRRQGLYEISMLIQKFGGRKKIGQYIGFPTYSEYKGLRDVGFWKDIGNLKLLIHEKLLPIVKDTGYIPTEEYLVKNKLREIRLLIERFGGRKKISEYLGYPTYKEVKIRGEQKS
ncbi:hypothetical protein [Heyndrickxia ginsengihumi]|uniref:hypothetical protein n=1 Tax=Heyndrickxia ginsengihumi TaxID=363870 RepID=UPI003D1E4510